MNEDSPDGCYWLRCKDCKLRYAKQHTKERDECTRLAKLALVKLRDEGWPSYAGKEDQ